ncbi:hypothetical protein [Herpetosiphon gulosus]|uniref:Secreted protein n=1 Tax=Herpetosiphon gulosus TaxID=1973496 RepID=A0ABP9X5V9_9CHLR
MSAKPTNEWRFKILLASLVIIFMFAGLSQASGKTSPLDHGIDNPYPMPTRTRVRDCQVDCVFRPITPESVRQSEWPIGCESVPSLAA